jgi:hypothetical protein
MGSFSVAVQIFMDYEWLQPPRYDNKKDKWKHDRPKNAIAYHSPGIFDRTNNDGAVEKIGQDTAKKINQHPPH